MTDTDSAADVRSLSPAGDKAGPKPLWLDAWHDPVASIRGGFGPCILAANLAGDGDWRLVVADADMKLKVDVQSGCAVAADIGDGMLGVLGQRARRQQLVAMASRSMTAVKQCLLQPSVAPAPGRRGACRCGRGRTEHQSMRCKMCLWR